MTRDEDSRPRVATGESTTPLRAMSARLASIQVEVVEGTDAGKVARAGTSDVSVGTAKDNDLVLTDPSVSRYHCAFAKGTRGIQVRDLGSTNGTLAGTGMYVTTADVATGTLLRLGGTTLRVSDGSAVEVPLHEHDSLGELHGQSEVMRRLMADIRRAAPSGLPVLVRGESGTGKELVARALHDLGPRASMPFEVLDCGSIAPTLVASELFGHEKGAFTGADRQRPGIFERAHGGTLFLDEIGELATELQPALLGVLERKQVRRLGGHRPIDVDVRVISATHRDLRREVNSGGFRLDLYYRLAVVRLEVASLRERKEDIPLLVSHFARQFGEPRAVEELFSPKVLGMLAQHAWPGNVRELRNMVEGTLAMGRMSLEAPLQTAQASVPADGELRYKELRAEVLQRFERDFVRALRARAGKNVSQAARLAGLDRNFVAALLRKYPEEE